MAEQPRISAGNSNGGQFAETRRDDDVDDLNSFELSDEEYNQEATYYWPNPPRSLAQLVKFWKTVPVPDEVLSRLKYRYFRMVADDRQQLWDENVQDWVQQWEEENPLGRREARTQNNPARQRARQEWLNQRVQEEEAQRRPNDAPSTIHPLDVRSVARAWRAEWNARAYWGTESEEYQRLMDDVEWPVGATTRSTRYFVETYQMDRLADATIFDDSSTHKEQEALDAENTHSALQSLKDELEQLRQSNQTQNNLGVEQVALLEDLVRRMGG